MSSDGQLRAMRSFNLDEDVIPATHYLGDVVCLNHGRCVTRNSEGRWLALLTGERGYLDRNFLLLAVADCATVQGSDFREPIIVAGQSPAWRPPLLELGEADGRIAACAMLMDREDRLHVLYQSDAGVFHVSAMARGQTPSALLEERGNWSDPDAVAGAGAALGDVLLDAAGQVQVFYSQGGQLRQRTLQGREVVVAEQAEHPSVHLDAHGTLHLAFERERMIYYLRGDANGWSNARGGGEPELVAQFCSSWPSLVVTRDGLVIVAYQGEGKVDLRRFPEAYDRLRPAGGGSVSYAVLRDGTWSHHDLARSRDIVLRRPPSGSNSGGNYVSVARLEELWRPSLTLDAHGVPWLLYLNPIRRHVYWSRFLGEGFAEIHEARGGYDALSRVLLLQKDTRGQGDIGFLTVACNRACFDAIPVPSYASTDARRVVFLDNLEVDRVQGLEHQLGQWRKHPQPVFGWGISGESLDDNIVWCRVHRVAGGFEMHYMGGEKLRSNWMPGRAFSRDGVRWEKRPAEDVARLTLDGQPFPNAFWRPIYLEDPEERDPARRFKGLHARYLHDREIEIRRWVVVTSPDAVHWRTEPDVPAVVLGDISVDFHLLRDEEGPDPRRRYKVLMLNGSVAGRAVSVFTSPDLLHWERVNYVRLNPDDAGSALSPHPVGPIAIDADAGENPWEEEVHDAAAWREHGLLMFHYDAFYFGANQHTQKALAVSRDGRHYWRVKRGGTNMPNGAVGEWDSGRGRTAPPLRVGDELWLYYCGMPAGHFSDPEDLHAYIGRPGAPAPADVRRRQRQRPWRVGLAKLRAEGWAYWQLRREAPEGVLTTIAFVHKGGELTVNGTDLGAGLLVELRDAEDGGAVAGYEAHACRTSARDSVNARLTWPAGPIPQGRYRLRFIFRTPAARLYSFGFQG